MSDTQSLRGDDSPPIATGRPGYFIVRIGVAADDGAMRGVIEQLGSGEKWVFHSSRELAGLVDEWARRRARRSAGYRQPEDDPCA